MVEHQDDIKGHVEAFAAELTTLVRRAAVDAVREALGESAPRLAKTAPARRARPPAKRAARRTTSKHGGKRDPKVLAKLVERLAEYIKANPGQRMEEITEALGVDTKGLKLPIKKLLAEKRITSKGQKRATTYSPK
jgi:hypothetical protein